MLGGPGFRLADLDRLAAAFDAVGEVLEMAAEKLSGGEAADATLLLAGLGIPVPAGLPGRMFLQESLAQARPLALLGVWHRLAVCRWVASSLDAIAREMSEPDQTESPNESAETPCGSDGLPGDSASSPGDSADCRSRDADR